MLIACQDPDEAVRILDALAPVRPSLVARTVEAAVVELARRPFPIVLGSLCGADTMRLFREAARLRPESVRLVVAERGDASLGPALANGTLHDVVFSPWTASSLRSAVDRATALTKARQALLRGPDSTQEFLGRAETRVEPDWLIGARGGLAEAVELARRVARSDATVLVRGETGTGKELIARLIQESSTRSAGPFVRLNCAAIADGVLESELFGHEPGSFTGATRKRAGRFELASTGTLFLDEVADISPSMQVRLLRVLQEREIERVGGSTPVPIDVRIIAATHRSLEEMVARGEFREDLFYRLNVVPIHLPPLRERRQDIPELVRAFVERYRRGDAADVRFDDAAMEALVQHPWPGNVRELENAVQRCVVLAQEGRIGIDQLLAQRSTPSTDPTAREIVRAREAEQLQRVLLDASGNCSRAARELGIPRTTLVSRARRLGLL
jgi:two-component system, NtrC family, response regulator HydG